jgi:hypothetical protein
MLKLNWGCDHAASNTVWTVQQQARVAPSPHPYVLASSARCESMSRDERAKKARKKKKKKGVVNSGSTGRGPGPPGHPRERGQIYRHFKPAQVNLGHTVRVRIPIPGAMI